MNRCCPVLRPKSWWLLAALAAAGCTEKMTIYQIPPFYTKDLKCIAVVPFRSPRHRGAGDILADKLAALLQASGTYERVYNRNDLRAWMNERDLAMAMSDDPAAAAASMRKLGTVQAILAGSVGSYDCTQSKSFKQDPVYGRTRKGTTYVAGYRKYYVHDNTGVVSATASLIRVSDGATIYSTPGAVGSRQAASGERPKYDPIACREIAADKVAAQLLEHFAIVRKTIKVDPAKALLIATGIYDNKWDTADAFDAAAEEMHVVVNLPAVCDRNNFKLAIVRDGEREFLAERPFTWSRSFPAVGKDFVFSPKEIAAGGGGPGAYLVKFYSWADLVMTKKFWVR